MKPVALIIDDEVQIRRLLRIALEGENYQVHEAENGQQGLIEIANRKPAVILLDLGLPDMDGLEVLKRLREWSEVPVVVLTVRDDEQEKVAALDAGAEDLRHQAIQHAGIARAPSCCATQDTSSRGNLSIQKR